jgi:hypothetical protein
MRLNTDQTWPFPLPISLIRHFTGDDWRNSVNCGFTGYLIIPQLRKSAINSWRSLDPLPAASDYSPSDLRQPANDEGASAPSCREGVAGVLRASREPVRQKARKGEGLGASEIARRLKIGRASVYGVAGAD